MREGLVAKTLEDLSTTYDVHFLFLGQEAGVSPLVVVGGDQEDRIRNAEASLRRCYEDLLKPPEPPAPCVVLSPVQERYLVCQQQHWVDDFTQRHGVLITYGQPRDDDVSKGKTELWNLVPNLEVGDTGNIPAASHELHRAVASLISTNIEISFPSPVGPLVEAALSYGTSLVESEHGVACLFKRIGAAEQLTIGGGAAVICTCSVSVCAPSVSSMRSATQILRSCASKHYTITIMVPLPMWPVVMSHQDNLQASHNVVLLPQWSSMPTSGTLPLMILGSNQEAVDAASIFLRQIIGESQPGFFEPVVGNAFTSDAGHGSTGISGQYAVSEMQGTSTNTTDVPVTKVSTQPSSARPRHTGTMEKISAAFQPDAQKEEENGIKVGHLVGTQGHAEEENVTEDDTEDEGEEEDDDDVDDDEESTSGADFDGHISAKDIERQICVPGPIEPSLLQTLQTVFSITVTTASKSKEQGYTGSIFSPSVDIMLSGSSDDVMAAVRYLQEQLCQE